MNNIAAKNAIMLAALFLLSACGGSSSDSGTPTTTGGISSSIEETISAAALIQPAPVITGFSPAWQQVGSAITIYGANFDTTAANNSVVFANNQQAVVAAATENSLLVIVPVGTTSGVISVATSGGSVTSPTSFVVKTNGGGTAPTITSFPTSSTIGSAITIVGTNFDASPENNKVTFNGSPAIVTQATATSLNVTVPAATNGNITVTTPGGTVVSTKTFTVTPIAATTPTIHSFTPLRGTVGTVVTLSGLNFDPVSANNIVRINQTQADVLTATATQITATIPVGATSGTLTVTAAGITAKSSKLFTVTAGGTPVVGLMGGAIQGTPLGLTGTALTFAGGGVVDSATNGTGANARFNNPNGMTSDGTNLYIADSGNRLIRRIDMLTGEVTTIAGSGLAGSIDGTGIGASFSTPNGITTDGVSLYIADLGNNRIRKITPLSGTLAAMTSGNAQVSTLAGSGSAGFTDAPLGINAKISAPYGITTDGTNVYVTDGSNRIRKIVIATSTVTTLAGSGAFSSTDGTGAGASFYRPHGITISPDNTTLYVTDSGTNVIRKIDIASAVVTGLLGPGFFDTTSGKAANFQNPNGISTDGVNLYVADSGNSTIRRIVISNLQVSTMAGTGFVGSVDDTGVLASFRLPNGIVASGGNLYISDSGNNLIRKIEIATKVVSTLAGNVVTPSQINGIGVSSKFNFPHGITSDGSNLYVADSGDRLIRKIAISTGVVTTLAGSGFFGAVDARGTAASFNYPFGLTTDGINLYVADTGNNLVRQIDLATGDVTTLAGSGLIGASDEIGQAASFNQPAGITTDGVFLYVADSGNHKIRKIEISTAAVTTLAGSGTIGATDATGTAASFSQPVGITTDGINLYIADSNNNKIRQIAIATGEVSTLTGSGAYWYNDVYDTVTSSWLGTAAHFRHPVGITTDGISLYVADSDNNEIRQIDIATGAVTTLSGSGTFGALDGSGTAASFGQPVGITTDGVYLYTTEYLNNLIRKIQ